MTALNRAVKAVAEIIAIRSGAAWLARRRRRSASLVLAYHNIVPDGGEIRGDVSLHLPRRAFGAQLDLLMRTHEVVPLADILRGGGMGRPRVAITFDDAYCGAVTVGIAELARRGLPATVFVAPAFVGGHALWWDQVETVGPDAITSSFRASALERDAGRHDAVLERAAELGLAVSQPPVHARVATEEELHRALAHPGVTLGSHSWSHPNLAALAVAELEHELRGPKVWLEERFRAVVAWIAYPYGLASEAVERAAERAGYVAALRSGGGWIPREAARRRYSLPRLNVPSGMSLRGLSLRASGIRAA